MSSHADVAFCWRQYFSKNRSAVVACSFYHIRKIAKVLTYMPMEYGVCLFRACDLILAAGAPPKVWKMIEASAEASPRERLLYCFESRTSDPADSELHQTESYSLSYMCVHHDDTYLKIHNPNNLESYYIELITPHYSCSYCVVCLKHKFKYVVAKTQVKGLGLVVSSEIGVVQCKKIVFKPT